MVGVEGSFSASECVTVMLKKALPDGGVSEQEVAKAIVEFDNVDLEKIKGLKSSQFAAALGYQSSFSEVCHRDNVILTVPPPSPEQSRGVRTNSTETEDEASPVP